MERAILARDGELYDLLEERDGTNSKEHERQLRSYSRLPHRRFVADRVTPLTESAANINQETLRHWTGKIMRANRLQRLFVPGDDHTKRHDPWT
jgi:hypothetical protein